MLTSDRARRGTTGSGPAAKARGHTGASRARTGLYFGAPAIVFFTVFYLYPLLWALYISFNERNLLGGGEFIGIGNYLQLLRDSEFLNSLVVTTYYAVGVVVPTLAISLGLALVFNRAFRLRSGFLTAYYIPAVVSLTAWSMGWLLMYNPSFGFLTVFTSALGFDRVAWLADGNLAMPALILLSIIKAAPLYMLIYLVGLQGIPDEYYQAARVDGAGALQRFWRITLPLLRPVQLYVVVVSFLTAFQQVFVPAFLLTGGGPGSATRVLPLFIYQTAFQNLEIGYASAASIVQFLLLAAVALVLFRLLRERTSQ